MKALVSSKVTINAATARVFLYLAELKYHQLWNPHLVSISPVTTLKKDIRYDTVSNLLGVKVKGKNVVTKLTNNSELEISNTTGLLNWIAHYNLQTDGNKTLLVCTTAVSSKKEVFAFTAPVLEILAKRELQSDLKALKIAVEKKLPPLS